MKKIISYVIPCYNCEKYIENTIKDLIETITVELIEYDYEIILVNDSSKDNTISVIEKLVSSNPNIVLINFSKNFGQHSALMAGLRSTNGDIIVCLDDDGQTAASEIKKIINKLDNEIDVVYAKYEEKKHSIFRNFGSKINNLMAVKLINKPKDLYISSFFAMKKYIKDEVILYSNPYPYIIGLILRTTDRITNVNVTHFERKIGKSNYNLKKLVSLLMNGFTNFSVKPLRIALVFSAMLTTSAFLLIIYFILNKIFNPNVPLGWTSMIIVTLVIGSILSFILGLIGEYVGRIYMSINNNPQYVIRSKIDDRKEKK
ncbi:MAG: glycosyltransferase family 2 protein [Clostridia bacterium]